MNSNFKKRVYVFAGGGVGNGFVQLNRKWTFCSPGRRLVGCPRAGRLFFSFPAQKDFGTTERYELKRTFFSHPVSSVFVKTF